MITIATISKNEQLYEMTAYSRGVFSFRFRGDTTYTDDQAVEFYWNGVQSPDVAAPLISGVRTGTTQLIEVTSLYDCLNNDNTFFYASPVLYVHYTGNAGDYSQVSASKAIQQANTFVSNNFRPGNKNYFGNTLYEPLLTDSSDFTIAADPLKLGLVATNRASITVQKSDELQLAETIGAVCEILTVAEGDDLDNAERVFKGFTEGARKSETDVSYSISEQRFFYDVPTCPNVFSYDDYPAPVPGAAGLAGTYGLDSSIEGKPLPVAFGDIRRGICVPINSKKGKDGAGYVEPTSGSHDVTFVVADPLLGSVQSITALYDDNGNEVPIQATDLVNNTVTFRWSWTDKNEKPKYNFKRFRWEGTGYDLGTGYTYNNGLDIIRWAFVNIAGLIFVDGVFDVSQWALVAAENNQAIGLSIQSDKGITREVIEPITVSLQIVVLSKGDGRLTAIDRDTDALETITIDTTEIIGDIDVDYNSDDMVSSLVVSYAPDFVDDDFSLVYEDITERDRVIQSYGLDRKEPLSTVRTVLRDFADVEMLSSEILETSTDPQRLITVSIAYTKGMIIEPFDMVLINRGRYGDEMWSRCEVLSVKSDYNNYRVTITARIIEDVVADETVADAYGDAIYGESVYG